MFAGTIVASNYIRMAQLLGESFLRHHPTSRFAILVIDDGKVDDSADGIEILRLADLDLPAGQIEMMKTIYDVMEFSTAVKPSLLQTLLHSDGIACYIDPDIYVYAPFDDAVEAAATSGIVLTPHVLTPVPRDGLAVSEQAVMQSGIFNLGFIAVGTSAGPFLDWWMTRLLTDAIVDLDQYLFTDQKWIDWVPALFSHFVSRDPGMNVAWWNIHERDVRIEGGRVEANGVAVRFIHFSGYDPTAPDVLSKHQLSIPRERHAPGTAIRDLADDYGRELITRGHLERRADPYQWSATPAGLRLTPLVRRICRTAAIAQLKNGAAADTGLMPGAFDADGRAFLAWLTEPTHGTAKQPISRVEAGLWESRSDLQQAFPNIDGADAAHFRRWLSVEDDAVTYLGELAPPRRPLATPPTILRRARSLVGRLGRRVPMPLRSRLSRILRGRARCRQLERSVDALRTEVAELTSRQDEALAHIREAVTSTLNDIDQRVAALDRQTP